MVTFYISRPNKDLNLGIHGASPYLVDRNVEFRQGKLPAPRVPNQKNVVASGLAMYDAQSNVARQEAVPTQATELEASLPLTYVTLGRNENMICNLETDRAPKVVQPP